MNSVFFLILIVHAAVSLKTGLLKKSSTHLRMGVHDSVQTLEPVSFLKVLLSSRSSSADKQGFNLLLRLPLPLAPHTLIECAFKKI